MNEKKFCESGTHDYKERDVVASVFSLIGTKRIWIVVMCERCDSKFLREVERLL